MQYRFRKGIIISPDFLDRNFHPVCLLPTTFPKTFELYHETFFVRTFEYIGVRNVSSPAKSKTTKNFIDKEKLEEKASKGKTSK